jgi:hypothetical protein
MGALSSFQPLRSNLTFPQVMQAVLAHGSLLSQQFDLEIDYLVNESNQSVTCSVQLPHLLNTALSQAACSALPGSLIEIASHSTRRGLEFEIVLSECAATEVCGSTFSRQSLQLNNGYQLSTYQARCPDGTLAWIVVQSASPRFRR